MFTKTVYWAIKQISKNFQRIKIIQNILSNHFNYKSKPVKYLENFENAANALAGKLLPLIPYIRKQKFKVNCLNLYLKKKKSANLTQRKQKEGNNKNSRITLIGSLKMINKTNKP